MTRAWPPLAAVVTLLMLLSSRTSLAVSAPVHRIGVRQVGGVGELYDTDSGDRFVARGANYTRLGNEPDFSNNSIFYHVMFRVGLYDSLRAEAGLEKMSADGYTVVRVLLDPLGSIGGLTNPSTGVSSPYVANLVDFLHRADANGLHVIIAQDFLPQSSRYGNLLAPDCCTTFDSENLYYLTAGGLQAWKRYYSDFIARLKALGAPLPAILAYELRNELYFVSNVVPLTLTSGIVTTGNGLAYDMASAEQKQAMMDDNLVYWIDQLRTSIRGADPSALVAVGFFEPQSPNPSRAGDPRVIRTYPAIGLSTADFVDLHAYPGGLTLPQYVENFEIGGQTAKPILMGEFGGYHFVYATAADAARGLQDWQAQSCAFGFDGWLGWTWDTSEQPELWTAMDEDETINRALAPQSRPDPCAGVTPVVGPPGDLQALAPAPDDTLPTNIVTMSWTTATDAETYQLQVGKSAALTERIYDSATLVATNHTLAHLVPGRECFWRVRAFTLEGASAWTGVRRFVPLLPAPTRGVGLSPAQNVAVVPIPVQFVAASCTPLVDRYEFVLATDSLFTGVLADSIRPDTSCTIRITDNSTMFWWRVRAHNDAGWGEWSDAIRIINANTAGVASAKSGGNIALLGSAPNPCSSRTRLRLSLPEATVLRLRLVDVGGRTVRTLFAGPMGPGEHAIDVSRQGIPAGLYFYRLETPSVCLAEKLVVVD